MTETDRFDILGVGVATVDDFIHVRSFPEADQKVPILKKNRKPGGLVATALAAAARVGARCTYYGTWGPDELSSSVRREFDRAGIDSSRVMIRPGTSVTHSLIVVAEEGHTRTIFYELETAPVPLDPTAAAMLRSARVLLTDQLGAEVAREAHRLSIPVVADLDWADRPDIPELLSVVDHLIVSCNWARAYAGSADPHRCVRELHAGSARACTAVTYGSEGCYYLHGSDERLCRQDARAVTAAETTGCGDVFHGAYAACLAGGGTVPECIAYASAAATLYASRPSGWEHLPLHREIEALRRGA